MVFRQIRIGNLLNTNNDMKKIITLLSMAALIVMGAMITSCNKMEEAGSGHRVNPDGSITYTTTLHMGASTKTVISEGGAHTFKAGDQIAVIYSNGTNTVKATSAALIGKDVDIFNDNRSARFTLTLTEPFAGSEITYVYPASMVEDNGSINYDAFGTQDGTLTYLANNLDYCRASGSWDGTGDLPTRTLVNQITIGKFTLESGSTPITSSVTSMTVSDGTNSYAVTPSSLSAIWVAMTPITAGTVTITANTSTAFYTNKNSISGKTLSAGNIYPVNVTMQESNIVDLSKIYTNFTAQDGQTLTGTLGANVKISIADGATVILNGVTINGTNSDDYQWAGISCEGDATIILSGTNSVTGFHQYHPGIRVLVDKTLTINGTGVLNASSNGRGAGIGGGWTNPCGNIVIEGGTITANGGSYCAGIGGGTNACGDITISGGTITAQGGMNGAGIGVGTSCNGGDITISGGTITAQGGGGGAGIGSGAFNYARCGDITITSGVTKVTATMGEYGTNSIGAGTEGTCGTVTIGGVETGNITTSPYTYPSLLLSGQFTINGSGDKVQFSRGNLKRVDGTWSFHTNQYDYLGFIDNNMCDLFYWETTGNYGSGLSCVTSSGSASDVVDWGANMGAGWKTLTKDEWVYLFNTRTNASSKYGHGRVNGLKGMIILPDSWTLPDGLSFTAGNSSWTNSYTTVQWSQMEAAGAVFLPAIGWRDSDGINSLDIDGYYWSSSPNDVDKAYSVSFYGSYLNAAKCDYQFRNLGCAVRLVKDVN